jgi:hypothetical protein
LRNWRALPFGYALSPAVKTVPLMVATRRAVAVSARSPQSAMSPAPTRTGSRDAEADRDSDVDRGADVARGAGIERGADPAVGAGIEGDGDVLDDAIAPGVDDAPLDGDSKATARSARLGRLEGTREPVVGETDAVPPREGWTRLTSPTSSMNAATNPMTTRAIRITVDRGPGAAGGLGVVAR